VWDVETEVLTLLIPGVVDGRFSPDCRHLAYITPGRNGPLLHLLDRVNGEIGLSLPVPARVEGPDMMHVLDTESGAVIFSIIIARQEPTPTAPTVSVRRVLFALEGDSVDFYEWIQVGCVEENDFCRCQFIY
jgi:hypothetical protein